MIHGGPRYLEFDWRTTRLSCEDAGRIVKIARHLVHRVLFLLPVLPGDRHGLERMETAMEVYDRFQPLKGAHPHARLTASEARRLEPGLSRSLLGAVTMEEWGVDPHRLAFANIQDAVAAGATAHNHSRATEILSVAGEVAGVRYRRPDGSSAEARCRAVVNAAGPWSPAVAALGGGDVRLRPAKGIHIQYGRRLSNFAVSAEAIDGRDLLLVPHGPFSLLGTTDDDFYGDLDAVEALDDEVEYVLQAFERVMPDIRSHRPLRVTTGVRPTLFEWRRYEDDLSRRHRLYDHGVEGGLTGMYTITGGKLSMYRLMAEAAADAVAGRLDIVNPCLTAARALPGSEGDSPDAADLARARGISALAAARVIARHGSRSEAVLAERGPARLVCRCAALLEEELVHAVHHEQVHSVADALRRVGAGSGPCAGTGCVDQVAQVVGRELGWSPAQRREAAADFISAAWPGRQPVLDRWGWAQEELARGLRMPGS